ncbi:hypothetical protein EKL02_03595 [Janthinobacterium sp. 17J80-10]|nr:hypothetical protein EKL02_03595 [Janthinobacterium sp. 17J80-10]
MTKSDVIDLFMEAAGKLEKTPIRREDTILQLAQLIADTRATLSAASLAGLVHIGATIYKANLSQSRARKEIAATMLESVRNNAD